MHPELRSRFNADFTPEKYAALLRCVNEGTRWPADFRLSETPIFLTREFTDEIVYAANEIAVQAFLDHRIGFLDISKVVGETLSADAGKGSNGRPGDLGTVLGTDARARVLAEEICQRVGT